MMFTICSFTAKGLKSMRITASKGVIKDLRARIAVIEERPLAADFIGLSGPGTPAGPLWASPPRGVLCEVWTDESRNGGARLAFALAQARSFLDAAHPAIVWLQQRHQAQQAGLPYGAGLSGFGIDPETLVIGQPETLAELLWATEESVACRAVAAVIATVPAAAKLYDFTASRRLSLRAQASKVPVFLLCHGRARQASAAHLRWHVQPAASARAPFDARAPGRPRFAVTLEKAPQGLRGTWVLEWNGNGFEQVADRFAASGEPAVPAASGAVPAFLGHRLSEAG
jgi:protein ImuA